MKRKLKKEYGITLVALVITIIILLILAGVIIVGLSGNNGLMAKVQQTQKKNLKAEMKENLTLALQNLQLEKKGNATLDDLTQEWLNIQIKEYAPILKEDASLEGKLVVMKKNNIAGKFLIDANLNILENEYNIDDLEFEYETKSRNDNNVEILIKLRDKINGIEQIDYPDGKKYSISRDNKDYIEINYTVELGKQYKFIIIAKDGNKVERTIKIDEYFYNVTLNFGEGATIDNKTDKVSYNKEYNAKITIKKGYKIDSLKVKMGEEEINTDKTNCSINIANVTGNIEITVITEKIDYFEALEYPILTQ